MLGCFAFNARYCLISPYSMNKNFTKCKTSKKSKFSNQLSKKSYSDIIQGYNSGKQTALWAVWTEEGPWITGRKKGLSANYILELLILLGSCPFDQPINQISFRSACGRRFARETIF